MERKAREGPGLGSSLATSAESILPGTWGPHCPCHMGFWEKTNPCGGRELPSPTDTLTGKGAPGAGPVLSPGCEPGGLGQHLAICGTAGIPGSQMCEQRIREVTGSKLTWLISGVLRTGGPAADLPEVPG